MLIRAISRAQMNVQVQVTCQEEADSSTVAGITGSTYQTNGLGNIVNHERKVRVLEPMFNVLLGSSEEIVHNSHFMSLHH